MTAEIGAALDAGDAPHARRLADAALSEAALTPLERGRLLLDRGLAQELQGDHAAALADFTGALQTRALSLDERAQALLQRGFLLDGLNRLDDAQKDYSAVVALQTPIASTALNNRANIHRRQGRLMDARRDYLAALAANSARPQYPYYGLGQIAEAQHDVTAARGFYARAVTADPDYRMAAERLNALGGPPETALAQPDRIALKPPKASTPLVPAPAASRTVPVAAGAVVKPGLRPALDQGADPGAAPSQVQLGAWRSQAEAEAGWRHAHSVAGHLLDGLSPQIISVDLPAKGRFFRLRVAVGEPAGFCVRLRALSQPCTPVRN